MSLPPKTVKKSSHTNSLEQLAEEQGLLFTPSKAQRAIKARFWTIVSHSFSGQNPHQMTPMQIAQTVRDNRVMNWWPVSGFKDWFLNNTEHIERLEYLFDLSLTAAEEVLLSTDPKMANAKVNMVKIISELAKKMPSKGGDQFQDEQIARMSKEQLESYLLQHGVKLNTPVPAALEVTAEVSDED